MERVYWGQTCYFGDLLYLRLWPEETPLNTRTNTSSSGSLLKLIAPFPYSLAPFLYPSAPSFLPRLPLPSTPHLTSFNEYLSPVTPPIFFSHLLSSRSIGIISRGRRWLTKKWTPIYLACRLKVLRKSRRGWRLAPCIGQGFTMSDGNASLVETAENMSLAPVTDLGLFSSLI